LFTKEIIISFIKKKDEWFMMGLRKGEGGQGDLILS
jgi:hypothetical protein